MFQGAKVPGSESSTYGTFALGSESTWERKFQLPSPDPGLAGRGVSRDIPSLLPLPASLPACFSMTMPEALNSTIDNLITG